MPPIQQRDCQAPAVYWPKAGYGDDGLPYVQADSWEEIRVRWTERLRTGTDARGNAVTTSVTIAALRLVDGAPARLELDSFLWLGSPDEISGTASEPAPPDDLDRLWQVVTESIALDVRGRNERFEYGLMRFSDRLPIL